MQLFAPYIKPQTYLVSFMSFSNFYIFLKKKL